MSTDPADNLHALADALETDVQEFETTTSIEAGVAEGLGTLRLLPGPRRGDGGP